MELVFLVTALFYYLITCFLVYLTFSWSKIFDEDFTIKNLLLVLFWPITIWFFK